jgi:hypothetical protein
MLTEMAPMPLFKKKWKITFAQSIGQFGSKFELEDWIDLHKRISPAYAPSRDKRYVTLEPKIIKALRESTESRPDYTVLKQESQITDNNGNPVPYEPCAFLFLKGETANLQLLLKHVKEESTNYYEILAIGDKKTVDFICDSTHHRVHYKGEFIRPIDVLMDWIGKWTTDVFTGKATGLFIHAGVPPASEPIVYLTLSACEFAE